MSCTSKYGKLEQSHEKLSSSNDDLLASHASLKLAHEAIATKVISSEPLKGSQHGKQKFSYAIYGINPQYLDLLDEDEYA